MSDDPRRFGYVCGHEIIWKDGGNLGYCPTCQMFRTRAPEADPRMIDAGKGHLADVLHSVLAEVARQDADPNYLPDRDTPERKRLYDHGTSERSCFDAATFIRQAIRQRRAEGK